MPSLSCDVEYCTIMLFPKRRYPTSNPPRPSISQKSDHELHHSRSLKSYHKLPCSDWSDLRISQGSRCLETYSNLAPLEYKWVVTAWVTFPVTLWWRILFESAINEHHRLWDIHDLKKATGKHKHIICCLKGKGHPCTGTEALYRPYSP